jgi:putative phosphoesterase
MKILVISDTHDNYPAALRAAELAAPIDALIHLGDGDEDAEMLAQSLTVKVIRIAGNCDLGSTAPRELLWECEGKRILLAHGDRYGVKRWMGGLEQRGLEEGADAVLFGHTHQAIITTRSGILFVNPGTLMRSSSHKSCAVMEIGPAGITARLLKIQV